MKYMRIKSFNNFINESLFYKNYIWSLNKDDIKEYFYDLSDIGYIIDINFGFYNDDLFSELPNVGNNTPCYSITIIAPQSIFNNYSLKFRLENLTDSVLFAIYMINKNTNSEEILTIDNDPIKKLDLNQLKIENGIYYENTKHDSISICFISKNDVEINQIQLADIYGWKDAVKKDNKIWVKINMNDLANFLIYKDKYHIDLLKNWEEKAYRYYNFIDYIPDLNSIYELDKNNRSLLIKVLIKEFGIEEFGIEVNNEEDCVNYYMKSENLYKLVNIIKKLKEDLDPDDNPLDAIFDIIAEYRMNAHIDENYKDLINGFDIIVKKEFVFYKEDVIEEYEKITYYYLKFDSRWLYYKRNEYYLTSFNSLYEALENYFNNNYFDYELNPYWSDYGDYDSEDLNKQISAELTMFLNR